MKETSISSPDLRHATLQKLENALAKEHQNLERRCREAQEQLKTIHRLAYSLVWMNGIWPENLEEDYIPAVDVLNGAHVNS